MLVFLEMTGEFLGLGRELLTTLVLTEGLGGFLTMVSPLVSEVTSLLVSLVVSGTSVEGEVTLVTASPSSP